jgi:MoxR-like ATPase
MDIKDPNELIKLLDDRKYIADDEFVAALFLLIKLNKPLLIEGPPGVGKTEIAMVLADLLDTKLIRLQCYEGLDLNAAVYEWNYQKQLLGIKMQEHADLTLEQKEHKIFGEDYLLKRPLLSSIMELEKSPVLLIDELDRSDEEFEAFLLELLSVFQISIPEMGTIVAKHKPFVILTSNRTRELSDALKRRCLYHWIDYPDMAKEMRIVGKKLPGIEEHLLTQVVTAVQKIRKEKLNKTPGVSETIDWAESLMALGHRTLSARAFDQSLGSVLKSIDDIVHIKNIGMEALMEQ